MSTFSVPESVRFTITADDTHTDARFDTVEAWTAKMLEPSSLQALAQFVTQKMDHRDTAVYVGEASGSYNMIFHFRLPANSSQVAEMHVALRIPKPACTAPALLTEKIENEVCWMQYFEEHAIAKVPHVYAWMAIASNEIGHPYILMDFVDGEPMYYCQLRWIKSKEQADKMRLRTSYEEIAALYLELDRHRFDKIGSITRTETGTWAVTRRPLTHDMHSLAADVPDTPLHEWPTGPLSSAAEYKALVMNLHRTQQELVRSINIPGLWLKEPDGMLFLLQQGSEINMQRAMKTARGRILSRHALADPACGHFPDTVEPPSDTDPLPFSIFNSDFCSRNILLDPETGRIATLIDFEFTNAMPAVFNRDPPLFLLPLELDYLLKIGEFPAWMEHQDHVVRVFCAVLKRIEEEQKRQQHSLDKRMPMSEEMQASYDSMRWLVNYALNHLVFADVVYWERRDLFPPLDEQRLETAIQAYQDHTRNQIAGYEKERVALAAKEQGL